MGSGETIQPEEFRPVAGTRTTHIPRLLMRSQIKVFLTTSFGGWLCLLASIRAPAQLAITEVMPSASNRLGATPLAPLSDFWELTNFGDEGIDLTGYRWNDNAGGLDGDAADFERRYIGPGESIILVQSSPVTTEQQFREWWGLPDDSTLQ